MKFHQILFVLVLPLLVESSYLRTNQRKRKETSSDEAPKSKLGRLSVNEAESSEFIDTSSCDNLHQRKRKENPSDKYSKQKVARISTDSAESSGFIDAVSGDLEPKPNVASHNNSVSLIKTPDVVLFLIYSYLKCPYSSLPFVCNAFNESLKNYPLDMHFKSITSMNFDGPLKPSTDLARLMKLDRTYLNEKFDLLLSVRRSYFSLKSSLLAIKTVQNIFRTIDEVRRGYEVDKIVLEIMRDECFESFLAILHQFPALKFNNLETNFVCKFLKFIKNDNSTFIDNVHRLLRAYAHPDMFLKHLFSLPNLPDFATIFTSIVQTSSNINEDFIFKTIGESFSLINHDDLTKKEIQSIQERNERYILEYSRGKCSDFGPEFAGLCSDMISPDFTDRILTHEFVKNMFFLSTASQKISMKLKL